MNQINMTWFLMEGGGNKFGGYKGPGGLWLPPNIRTFRSCHFYYYHHHGHHCYIWPWPCVWLCSLYNIQTKLLTDRKVTLVVTDNLHRQ